MTHQLPLFQGESPRGKVWNAGDHWIATIDDWWMARGATETEAIRNVTRKYRDEMDALESGSLTKEETPEGLTLDVESV